MKCCIFIIHFVCFDQYNPLVLGLSNAPGFIIGILKNEIVKKAIELKVPLQFINSCYNNTKKHCGKCESCNRLKRALKNAQLEKLITDLFEE